MNCLKNIINIIQQRLCYSHAKYLAHIYAHYRETSARNGIAMPWDGSPKVKNKFEIVFETYCPSIMNKCDEMGIKVPRLPKKTPGKLMRMYLFVRFGWPWPTRLIIFEDNWLKVNTAKPKEMADAIQMVLDTVIAENNHAAEQQEISFVTRPVVQSSKQCISIPSKPVAVRPIPRKEEPERNATSRNSITRIVIPPVPQNRRPANTIQNASQSNKKPRQDTYTSENNLIKEDDIMDFSF